MKKRIVLLLNIALIAALLLFTALLIINRFLPNWMIWTAVFGLSLLSVTIVFYRLKTAKIILCILLLAASASIFYFDRAAVRLIAFNPIETSIFSFYVMPHSKVVKIEELSGKKLGYSSNLDDETLAYIKRELDTKISSYTLVEAVQDSDNLRKLKNGNIDVLILNNAMHQNLFEIQSKSVTELVLIGTIEKSYLKENIVKAIDVAQKPFIILISGIDISGPINLRSRSDVDILMVINPITKKVLSISIPRDTYVSLGCRTGGMDKLTDSAIYGIGCTVKTIEQLVGIDINYYVRVNFTSLLKLIDVIGNIDVYSKYAFKIDDFQYNVGMNSLNSARALEFSRARKSFATGDVQRGLNQQEVIKAIIKKMTAPAAILKVEGVIRALSDSIDTNLTIVELSQLIKLQLSTNSVWDIKSSNLSGTKDMKPTYSMGSRLLFVMHPSQVSLKAILENIKSYMMIPVSTTTTIHSELAFKSSYLDKNRAFYEVINHPFDNFNPLN